MWHGQWTQPLMMVTRRHCDGVTGVTTSCWWITTSQLQTKTIRNTQHQHSLLCSVSVIKYNRKNNFLFKEVWTVVLLSWLYFSVLRWFYCCECCVGTHSSGQRVLAAANGLIVLILQHEADLPGVLIDWQTLVTGVAETSDALSSCAPSSCSTCSNHIWGGFEMSHYFVLWRRLGLMHSLVIQQLNTTCFGTDL